MLPYHVRSVGRSLFHATHQLPPLSPCLAWPRCAFVGESETLFDCAAISRPSSQGSREVVTMYQVSGPLLVVFPILYRIRPGSVQRYLFLLRPISLGTLHRPSSGQHLEYQFTRRTTNNLYHAMDSRFILLVIFILLFASMTMAFPMDGTDDVYQDGDNIIDDLSGIAMNVVDFFIDLPTTSDGFVVVDNIDGAVASPGSTQGILQYLSPDPMNMQPYVHPQGLMAQSIIQQHHSMPTPLPNPANQVVAARMPGLTALNVMQLDQPQPQQDVAVQSWVDDSYATGYRNQSPQFQQASLDMQLAQEQSHNHTMQMDSQGTRRAPAPQPHPTTIQPTTSTASLGYLQCDHPGCETTCRTRGALNHHRRYHIPMHRRPYQCSLCPRRFLHPREVERHMTTHCVGPRHYCPFPRCPLAIRGLARRDHLLRHLRRFHTTPS